MAQDENNNNKQQHNDNNNNKHKLKKQIENHGLLQWKVKSLGSELSFPLWQFGTKPSGEAHVFWWGLQSDQEGRCLLDCSPTQVLPSSSL